MTFQAYSLKTYQKNIQKVKMESKHTNLDINNDIVHQFNQSLKVVIEMLIKPEDLRRDMLVALLYIIMKENGFLLLKGIGKKPIDIADYILAHRENDEYAHESVFVLKKFNDTPMKMIVCPLNDTILINVTIPEMYKETYSLCLKLSRYVVTSQLGIPSDLTNLHELFVLFKDKIVTPIKSSILNYHSRPSGNLSGLPEDVLSHIILWLPIKDVLNLSESCKRICDIVNTDSLWYLLYRRDFPDKHKSEGGDWREIYKGLYKLKQEAKFQPARNVSVGSFQEFAELPDFMRHVSDSRWEVIL